MPEIDLGDGAEALISATEFAVRETNVTWKGIRESVQVLYAADMDAYLAAALRERLREYERGMSSMFGLGKYIRRRNPVLDALCFLVSYVRDNPGKGGNIELILRKCRFLYDVGESHH
jgi:hypothetical protein